jgi:hypothetical protein
MFHDNSRTTWMVLFFVEVFLASFFLGMCYGSIRDGSVMGSLCWGILLLTTLAPLRECYKRAFQLSSEERVSYRVPFGDYVLVPVPKFVPELREKQVPEFVAPVTEIPTTQKPKSTEDLLSEISTSLKNILAVTAPHDHAVSSTLPAVVTPKDEEIKPEPSSTVAVLP